MSEYDDKNSVINSSSPTNIHTNSTDDNTDDSVCPLCLEEFDTTDRQFHPCACGYQICLWCWHSICQNGNGLCPACRTPYQTDNIHKLHTTKSLTTYDAEQLIQEQQRRRKEKRIEQNKLNNNNNNTQQQQQQQPSNVSTTSSTTSTTTAAIDDLTDIRIIQRNLVYVVGLPQSLARNDILSKKEYFGKFGKIVKVACARAPKLQADNKLNPYSAYITYKTTDGAADCIRSMDGHTLDGYAPQGIRCTYGTTKYCETWLNGRTCTSPTCLYLHSRAKPQDITTKEQLSLMWQNERSAIQPPALPANESPSHTHAVNAHHNANHQHQTSISSTQATTPTSSTSSVSPHTQPNEVAQRNASYAQTLHAATLMNGTTNTNVNANASTTPTSTTTTTAPQTITNTISCNDSNIPSTVNNNNNTSTVTTTNLPSTNTLFAPLTDAHCLYTSFDLAEQNNVPLRAHLSGVPSSRLHISTNYGSRLRLQSNHLPFDFSNFLSNLTDQLPPISAEQLFNDNVDDINKNNVYVAAVR